jgi:competence protein ComEA
MSSSRSGPAVRGYVALSLLWLAVLGVVLFTLRRPAPQPVEILPAPSALPSPSPLPSRTPAPLRVDVAGAVLKPAVYRLAPGSIVADAIAAAGGPAADADLDRVNKAQPAVDGMQVYVPRAGERATPQVRQPTNPNAHAGTPGSQLSAGNVNINTASLEELDALPGVGPSLAQKIIDGRPYGQIEDILRVPGIGQATFDKLKPHILVQ